MTCVSSITVSPSCKTLGVGETCYLTAVVCPTNATCKCVKWSSSNSNVATVTSSGFVKAQKTGTVTITATATDGSNVKDTMTLKVSPVSVSSVTLNRSQLTVNKGSSYCLTATVCPSNASNSSLSWCSSNTNVATVINGRVTGVGKGTATITAMAMDGSGKSDTCEVKVKVPVSSISVSSYCNPMNVGDVCLLSVSVYPYDADNRGVCWTSSKTNVVTVTSGGIVTAKSPGTAIITATAADGSGTHGCTEITVNKVGVTCLRLSKNQLSMDKNTGIELTAWVGPDNATNKSVRWSSSNSRVAEVNNGCVTANDGGTATITATSDDNSKCFDTCEINVKVPVESITIYYQALLPDALDTQLYVGESQLYEASVLPANATNKCIHWESSNTSVATVTSGGIVTARKAGTATIMAKATDGSGVVGQLCLSVHDPILIKSITLNKTCISVQRGKTYQLTADICPINATYKQVKWCSTNEQVAKVSASGVVTAKSSGSATIYCSALDGSGVCTACEVEVVVLVESIRFSERRGFLWLNSVTGKGTRLLAPVISPADATNKSLEFCSSNPNVVRVNPQSGFATAVSTGTATITATAQDGSGAYDRFFIETDDASNKTLFVSTKKLTVGVNDQGFDKKAIHAYLCPCSQGDIGVSWSSSNSSVASVESTRVFDGDSYVAIQGNKGGTAIITAEAEHGLLRDSCEVTVDPRPRATFEKEKENEDNKSLMSCGTLFKVTFHDNSDNVENDGIGENKERVWYSLGVLVRNLKDVESSADCRQAYRDRKENNYNQFCKDVNSGEEMEKVLSQLAYLYRFDPLGVEEFVKECGKELSQKYCRFNNSSTGDIIVDLLNFKDELFERIFGIEPRYFVSDERTNGCVECIKTNGVYKASGYYLYYGRRDVTSQAELLFGEHTIIDWKTFFIDIATATFKLLLGIGFAGSKVFGQFEKAISSADFAFDIFHAVFIVSSFSEFTSTALPNISQKYLESIFDGENITDQAVGKAVENAARGFGNLFSIAGFLLDFLDALQDLIHVPELTKIAEIDDIVFSGERRLDYRTYIKGSGNSYFLEEIEK